MLHRKVKVHHIPQIVNSAIEPSSSQQVHPRAGTCPMSLDLTRWMSSYVLYDSTMVGRFSTCAGNASLPTLNTPGCPSAADAHTLRGLLPGARWCLLCLTTYRSADKHFIANGALTSKVQLDVSVAGPCGSILRQHAVQPRCQCPVLHPQQVLLLEGVRHSAAGTSAAPAAMCQPRWRSSWAQQGHSCLAGDVVI